MMTMTMTMEHVCSSKQCITSTHKQCMVIGPFCDGVLDCHFCISPISRMKSLIRVDWFHSLMEKCLILVCSDSCKISQFHCFTNLVKY